MAPGRALWIIAIVLCVAMGASAQSSGRVTPNAPAPLPAADTPADVAGRDIAAGIQNEQQAQEQTPEQQAAKPNRPDRPLPATANNKEDQLVGGGTSARSSPIAPPQGKAGSEPHARTDYTQWWRLIAAMAVVLALIGAMRWVLRRASPGRGTARASKVVEVLSRTPVSAKHNVMLIRVGQRVLVVGAGAESMNTLAEIEDPQQVSELLGAVEQGKAGSLSSTFAKALGSWRGQLTDADMPTQEDLLNQPTTPAGGAAERIRSLAERVRGLGMSFRRRG